MARRGGGARRPGASRRQDRDYLYGRNAVGEALRSRRVGYRLLVRDGADRRDRIDALVKAAEHRGIVVEVVGARLLDELTGGGNHQGVVLEAGHYPYVELDEILREARGRTLVLLDRVKDPQNLATLIRTAAAVDAAGVIIQTDRSASVTPAVAHASAGVVEHVYVAQVTNSGRAIDVCKRAGYWSVAIEAVDGAIDLFSAEIPDPVLLIVGSEGGGVSVPAMKAADIVVRLPMPGNVESLNAAVAGSVVLYELLRRSLAGSNALD